MSSGVAEDGRAARGSVARELTFAGLHLAVLWSFAFAQPLLNLLGDSPEFFVARGNTRGDILLLAWGLVLVPPLVLTGLEGLAEIASSRLRRALHGGLVAVLAAALALELLPDADLPAGLTLAAAAIMGALTAFAYERTVWARSLLTVLSPAPLFFVAVFTLISPVSKLVMPGAEAKGVGVAVPGDPPVTVIVFDELAGFVLNDPSGRIDASRFPNFARLAGDATWYRNATTVADFTEQALPALLTGNRPDNSALPIAADHPDSLFTLLGGRYSLDVTEPVTDLCPPRLCPKERAEAESASTRRMELVSDLSLVSLHLLLPDALASRLAPVDRSFGDFRAGRQATQTGRAVSPASARGALAALSHRTEIVRTFQRGLAAAPRRRRLTFFHVELPHSPYEFLPSGQRYTPTLDALPGLNSENQPVGGAWGESRALARHAFERYLLQVRYADRVLGQILDRLQQRGLYDRGLVVVAADHGASFIPGTAHRAGQARNLATVAGIPLLIKAPGQRRGRVDGANVHITDVLPTMAERLGVRLPWRTDGHPAEQAGRGGRIALQPNDRETELTMSFSDFVRQRDELVKGMDAFFPAGPDGLYRGGPARALVGAEVGRFPAAAGATFELDGEGLLADVRPRAAVVPSMVSGSVEGVPRDSQLAVAVNGRVAATATQYEEGRVARFAAIVPPSAFVHGPNRVELVAQTRDGVVRISPDRARFRLIHRDGRELMLDSAGRELSQDGLSTGGFLDGIHVKGNLVTVSGWAADPSRKRVADRVVAFAGGSLLGAARPSLPRIDVAQTVERSLLRSGFKFSGWSSSAPGAAVRVFALYGRRAVPLTVANAP